MALINCPECGKQVSDTASVCPNCGYAISNIDKDFTPIVTKLSEPMRRDFRKVPTIIISVLLLGFIILTIVNWRIGLFFLAITFFVGAIILFATAKKYQQGDCPYCGTALNFDVGSSKTFKCPKCGNVGKRNETTLESIHK